MQVQKIQNNSNYNTSFGQKLRFNLLLHKRATLEENAEMNSLISIFKKINAKEGIRIKNDSNKSVRRILDEVWLRYYNAAFGQKVRFDLSLISRATTEDKAILDSAVKGIKGFKTEDVITIKDNPNESVSNIFYGLMFDDRVIFKSCEELLHGS